MRLQHVSSCVHQDIVAVHHAQRPPETAGTPSKPLRLSHPPACGLRSDARSDLDQFAVVVSGSRFEGRGEVLLDVGEQGLALHIDVREQSVQPPWQHHARSPSRYISAGMRVIRITNASKNTAAASAK